MEKICPKCLYRGMSKYTATNPSRLLWGGAVLGFAFTFLAYSELPEFINPDYLISRILELAIFFAAFYLLATYYHRVSNLCSKCTNEQMIDVNSPEAIELMKQYNVNELTQTKSSEINEKICTNCNYMGHETKKVYFFVLGPIILLILSFGYYINLDVFKTPLFATMGILIWVLFSLYTLVIFIDRKEDCPNCNKSKTMIPVDTPKAQILVKENNLTIPSESPEQTKAPST